MPFLLYLDKFNPRGANATGFGKKRNHDGYAVYILKELEI